MTMIQRSDQRAGVGRLKADASALALSLLPIRMFLAAGWVRAGVEKVIEPNWWNGTALRGFVEAQHDQALPFFATFMDRIVEPWAIEVAAIVAISEIIIGISIGLGLGLRTSLWWGMILNTTFVLAGRVNPSAFYMVMQIVLLQAIASGVLARRGNAQPTWSLAASVAWFLAALHFIPYVHTIQPAEVIEDPAMMLLFLAVILAVTSLLRWLMANEDSFTDPARFRTWVDRWVVCRDDGAEPLTVDVVDRLSSIHVPPAVPEEDGAEIVSLIVDGVEVDFFEKESAGSA